MTRIRYDWISAYNAGITMRPYDDVVRMGIEVIQYEHAPIGDCTLMEVKHLPDVLPSYIDINNNIIFSHE